MGPGQRQTGDNHTVTIAINDAARDDLDSEIVRTRRTALGMSECELSKLAMHRGLVERVECGGRTTHAERVTLAAALDLAEKRLSEKPVKRAVRKELGTPKAGWRPELGDNYRPETQLFAREDAYKPR